MSAFSEANRKAFNDLAATYNSKPWQIQISNVVAEALQSRRSWLGAKLLDETTATSSPSSEDVRLLDYACGTGAITKALGPYVSTIRGIDISEGMVTAYNTAASSSGLTHDQAHAVVGNLCSETPSSDEVLNSSEFENFDITVIGLGFHHFEHPALAIQRLGERLKPGTGVLVIVDFLPFELPAGHNHHHHHHGQGHGHHGHEENKDEAGRMAQTIKHAGFTPAALRELFDSSPCAFTDFDIVTLPEPVKMELSSGPTERTLFIAKARRA